MSASVEENASGLMGPDQLLRELSVLERNAEKPWRTHGGMHFPESAREVNIREANQLQLHAHLSQLVIWHRASQEAARLLSMPVPDSTYDGHTYAEWVSDIQKRAALLAIPAKRKKLEAFSK